MSGNEHGRNGHRKNIHEAEEEQRHFQHILNAFLYYKYVLYFYLVSLVVIRYLETSL